MAMPPPTAMPCNTMLMLLLDYSSSPKPIGNQLFQGIHGSFFVYTVYLQGDYCALGHVTSSNP